MLKGIVGSRDGGHDQRGQSEVIGVILLVAIAIVLAAVIGEIVFGLDIVQKDEQSTGPQIAFSTEPNSTHLTIEHESGTNVETSKLTVVRSDSGDFDPNWTAQDVGSEWESGESLAVPASDGETVRIIWQDPTTDDSAIIFEEEYSAP